MIVATSYAPECIEWFRQRAQQKLAKSRVEYVTAEVAGQLDSEAEQKRRAELLGAACESAQDRLFPRARMCRSDRNQPADDAELTWTSYGTLGGGGIMIVKFAPDSPEAAAAMRCADEIVDIPPYGRVIRASDDYVDGVHTVSATFAEQES